jgi:hypothetical protein
MLEYKEHVSGLLDSMSECMEICKAKKAENKCDSEFRETVNILIDSFISIQDSLKENFKEDVINGLKGVSEKYATNFEYIVISVNKGNENINEFISNDFFVNFDNWKNSINAIDMSEAV